MIAWFTRNHVAANLLMLFLLVIGLGSLSTRIPLEVFPSVDSEVVSVSISLRGATPEDVEQGVTIRVEEAVQDLEGIKKSLQTLLSRRLMSILRLKAATIHESYSPI